MLGQLGQRPGRQLNWRLRLLVTDNAQRIQVTSLCGESSALAWQVLGVLCNSVHGSAGWKWVQAPVLKLLD